MAVDKPLASATNHSTTIQDLSNSVLHSAKPHAPATLTLEMIHQSAKSRELPLAAQPRTMVKVLLVHWTTKVLIEAIQLCERSMTDVALVHAEAVVVRSLRSRVGGVVRSRVLEKFLGNHALRIATADCLVEGFAVRWGGRTGATLDVVD